VDSMPSTNQQCVAVAKKADTILGFIKGITSTEKEDIILLYSGLVRPCLEYCVQFWCLLYKEKMWTG